jgi:major vault protein
LQEPYIITSTYALHLRASKTFKDVYGIERKAGEEWLITEDMASHHILDIYEEDVGLVERIVLN